MMLTDNLKLESFATIYKIKKDGTLKMKITNNPTLNFYQHQNIFLAQLSITDSDEIKTKILNELERQISCEKLSENNTKEKSSLSLTEKIVEDKKNKESDTLPEITLDFIKKWYFCLETELEPRIYKYTVSLLRNESGKIHISVIETNVDVLLSSYVNIIEASVEKLFNGIVGKIQISK